MKHLFLLQYFAQWPTLWWLLIGQTTQKAGFPELIRGHFSLNTKFSLFYLLPKYRIYKNTTYVYMTSHCQARHCKNSWTDQLGTWWLSRSFNGFHVVEYTVLLYLYFFVSLYLSLSLSTMKAFLVEHIGFSILAQMPNYPSYSHGHFAHYRKEIFWSST